MSEGVFYLLRTMTDRKTFGPNIFAMIEMLLEAGEKVAVRVDAYKDPRTLDQNALHCALCREIASQLSARTGLAYDVEYFRTKTKRKFGITCEMTDPDTGKPEKYLLSTTKYTKAQFSRLIEGTLAWAITDLQVELDRGRWQ